jgi:hypothetical protein
LHRIFNGLEIEAMMRAELTILAGNGARTISRSIWPMGIQSRLAPRPASSSPIIVTVIGGFM